MPRPTKPRTIRHEPGVIYFKPSGVPRRQLEEVALGLDELEAIRLADIENLSHEELGSMMKVSRATAGRILAEARRKVAHAMVNGQAIRIEGGAYETAHPVQRRERHACQHGDANGQGRGRGRNRR